MRTPPQPLTTASLVIMNLSYFNMSNTFIVFTKAVFTPGIFLADFSTTSFLSVNNNQCTGINLKIVKNA